MIVNTIKRVGELKTDIFEKLSVVQIAPMPTPASMVTNIQITLNLKRVLQLLIACEILFSVKDDLG